MYIQMISRMAGGVPHRSVLILKTSHLVVVADDGPDRKSSVRAAERSILSQLGSSSSCQPRPSRSITTTRWAIDSH